MNSSRCFTLRYFLTSFWFPQLAASEEELKELQFFRSVVAPLIEAYWVSACGLLWLRNQSFSGKYRTFTDEGDKNADRSVHFVENRSQLTLGCPLNSGKINVEYFFFFCIDSEFLTALHACAKERVLEEVTFFRKWTIVFILFRSFV